MLTPSRITSTSNGISSLHRLLEQSSKKIQDHDLPPGWLGTYDAKTKKYYFIYELEGFKETELTARKKFESLWSKPIQERRITSAAVEENIVDKICRQFPDVDRSYIFELTKKYNNRENLIISALLSESHIRHGSPILNESLYYKLKQAFPHVEPDIIRKLLLQNENKEHPTIEALLDLFGLFNTTRYEHCKKPQLKLKYLKFAFPAIDEIDLLDLLFKNEFDAAKVIKHLKSIGHEPGSTEVKLAKVSLQAVVKEAMEKLRAPRPKSLLLQDKPYPNLWEQENIRKKLVELYPTVNIFLINRALESVKFDIELAKQFLDSMTPQDSSVYLQRSFPEKPIPVYDVLISRQVQTNTIAFDLFGVLFVLKTESNCEDIKKEMCEKSTWTDEDGILTKLITKLAIGADPENRKGTNFKNNRIKLHEREGPSVIRIGPNINNKKGPESKWIAPKIAAQGPDKNNRIGAIGRKIIRFKEKQNEFSEYDFECENFLLNQYCHHPTINDFKI